MFATALDRDELTRQRIARLVQQTTFSTAEREMLLLDWKAYRKRPNQLWQWYRQAQIANRPAAYLQRIIDVAILFNQQQPRPLSAKALEVMQQDLAAR